MEHIVQFAIGIDDEAIRNRITDAAEKQITESIQKDVERIIFDSGWNTGKVDKNSPKEWVKDMVKDVIEARKTFNQHYPSLSQEPYPIRYPYPIYLRFPYFTKTEYSKLKGLEL